MMFLFLVRNENFVEHNVLSQALPGIDVDASGNASGSIPIVVPPGSGGIVPELSVNYNSSSGFGLLGIGWDLSGIHTITRDSSYRISYDDNSDHYASSLGGQLVSSNGKDYYSKNENFMKFSRSGGIWIVKDKTGKTYQFGKLLTTTVSGKNIGIPESKTKMWVLDKVVGLHNKNYYEITYHSDSQSEGYPYPQTIVYNNNSSSKRSEILFDYYPVSCKSCYERYTNAGYQKMSKLLKSITIKNEGIEVNRYEFVYDSENKKLITIKRKAYGAENYKDISINYTQRTNLEESNIYPYVNGREISNMNFHYYADEETFVSDFGWGERALCNAGENICFQSSQPMNGDLKNLAVNMCALFYTKYKYMCGVGIERSIQFFVDVNGDTKPEFVRVSGGQLNNKITATTLQGNMVAESDAPFDLSKEGTIIPGDINGDGKTDFFIIEGYRDKNNPNKYLKLAISRGNSFEIKTTGILISNLKRPAPKDNGNRVDRSSFHFSTDFNGDGRADFVQVSPPDSNGSNTMDVYVSVGEDLQKFNVVDSQGQGVSIKIPSYGHEFHQFVDMNGDNIPEFVRVNVVDYATNNKNLLITYFDETGNVKETVTTNVDNTGSIGNRFLADINGDGMPDFIYYDGESLSLKIYFFNGLNFESVVSHKVSSNVHYTQVQEYTPYNPDLLTQVKEAWLQAETERLEFNFTYGTAEPDTASLETLRNYKQILTILFKNPDLDTAEDQKSYTDWLYNKTFADIDGDGRADFVYYDESQKKIVVEYSNRNTNSETSGYFDGGFSFSAGGFSDVVDINNDGKADFVGLYADYEIPMIRSNDIDAILAGKVDWAYRYNNSGRNRKGSLYAYTTPSGDDGLLYSMNDNSQKSVTLTYGQSYTTDSATETYPILPLKNHDTVLTKIDFQLGGGFTNQVTYTFFDRKYYTGNGNRHDKKLLGFRLRTSQKKLQSPKDVINLGEAIGATYYTTTIPNIFLMSESTTYNQYQYLGNGNYDVSLSGTMSETSMTYVNKSDILAKTTFTYAKKSGVSGLADSYWIANTQKQTETYDGVSPILIESIAYDAYGNETVKSTNSGGEVDSIEKTYYTADTDNWILGKIKDFIGKENGRIIKHKKFTYDSNHNISTVQELVDSVKNKWKTRTMSDYNDWGMPGKIIDSLGKSITYQYDDFLHSYAINESSAGVSLAKTYNYYTGKVISTTTDYGTTITEYDEHARLKRVKYPWEEAGKWSEEYTYYVGDAGNTYIKKSLKDGVSSGLFSSEGLWSKEYINPIGKVYRKESKGYTKDGKSVVQIEQTVYDARGREIIKIKPYLEGHTTFGTIFNYDSLGRLSNIYSKGGNSQMCQILDSQCSFKIINDDYRRETVITYDGLTEKHETSGFTYVKEATSDPNVSVYTMQKTQDIDSTEVTKNYRNEVVSSTRNGISVSYEKGYDADGYRYVKVVSNGSEISYQKFDTAGNKIFSRDRNTGSTTMVYDAEGKLLSTTNSKGETISYEYNDMYKITKIDKPGNEGDISFAYNSHGKPSNVIIQEYNEALGVMNDAYKETLDYDNYGRLVYSKKEMDDLQLIFQYGYDNLQRLQTVTYPNGITVRNHYSESGHLYRVTMEKGDDKDNEVVRYGILDDGRLQRLTGNNVDTYVVYDPYEEKPQEVVTKLDATHDVQKWSYAYDSAGNVLKISDLMNSKNTQEFHYDSMHRMDKATGVYGEDGKLGTINYVYDSDGNLKTKGNISMVYGDTSHPNAVTKIRVTTDASTIYDQVYAYDSRGNMTQRGDDVFKYNSMNQMVEYQKSLDDVTHYLYDYTGKRIKKHKMRTDEVVYRLGEYEVNRRPGKTDRHTIYVMGASGDMVAQYTQDGAVLVTDGTLNSEMTIWNKINTQRIQFLKFVTRTTSDYPYALKIFGLAGVFVLILVYFVPMYFANLKRREDELPNLWSNPFVQKHRVLSLATPLLLLSVVLVFGTGCTPEALKGHSKEPFWLMGTFLSPGGGGEGETPSISNPSNSPGSPSPGTPEVGMYFFHPDHLGSITMITDARGKVAAIGGTGATQVHYKPYGEINRTNSAGADIFRHKYTGQEEDPETGFYYYKSRYYDPFIGRFTQADTSIMPESTMGMNQYMYTEGNPVKFTDPSGHIKYEIFMARAKKDFQKAVIGGFSANGDIHAALSGYYQTNQKVDNEKTMDRKFYQHFLKAVAITILLIVTGYVGFTYLFSVGSIGGAVSSSILSMGIGYGVGTVVGYIAGGFSGGTVGGISGGKWDKERALRGAKQGGLIGAIVMGGIGKNTFASETVQDLQRIISGGGGFAALQGSITSAGMKDFQGFMLGEINIVNTGKMESSNEMTYRTSLFDQGVLLRSTSESPTGTSRCNLSDTQIKALGLLGGDVFGDESCNKNDEPEKIGVGNIYDYQKDFYNGFH
ncbi:MAG: hypothetical protein KDK90_25985 [Leptospiraceae bacterium]|nr:hypothetical protein [Leptospiraceae bacterium]